MLNDENEKYKKAIFQLDELLRHLLVDDPDYYFKKNKSEYWYKYWLKIEEENKEAYHDVFCRNDEINIEILDKF